MAYKGVPLYGRHSRVMLSLPSLDSVNIENPGCHFLFVLGKQDEMTPWDIARKLKERIELSSCKCELDEPSKTGLESR